METLQETLATRSGMVRDAIRQSRLWLEAVKETYRHADDDTRIERLDAALGKAEAEWGLVTDAEASLNLIKRRVADVEYLRAQAHESRELAREAPDDETLEEHTEEADYDESVAEKVESEAYELLSRWDTRYFTTVDYAGRHAYSMKI